MAIAGQIARHLDAWRLTPDGEPFETPSSWLIYVKYEHTPAVLKIPKPASDEHQGALALLHYDGRSAVRVLRHDDRALLMERALPGNTLTVLVRDGHDEQATHIICDVLLTLHERAVPTGKWKTVEDLALGFERYRRAPRHELISIDIVERAEAMFIELCSTQERRFLLHGDLHHANVLKDDHRGWLAIDPKGVVGDLAYEVATALHNPLPLFEMMADPIIMQRRVEIYASRLRLDPRRILHWCFAADVLHHLWAIEDGMDTSDFARSIRVAETAATLLSSS